MTSRPQAIAFDVIETLVSLEQLRPHFEKAGFAGPALELWFATALRDMFALTAAGTYAPMAKLLESALDDLCASRGAMLEAEGKKRIVQDMGSLPPHPDTEPGLTKLKNAGFPLIALTNGSRSTTQKLLESAGVSSMFEKLVSTDDVGRAKPHPEVYLHAAREIDVEPGDLMLVAVHPWDIHGAKCAGLKAAYLDRGKPFPDFMKSPDLTARSLTDLADSVAELGSRFVSHAAEEITH